jgi:tetratricopeptide (TPR) repeat protein
MIRQRIVVPTILFVCFLCAPAMGQPTPGDEKPFDIRGQAHAEAIELGNKLLNEGKALYESAQSPESINRAVEKYEEALSIFQKQNFYPGVMFSGMALGVAYHNLHDYTKAAEYYEKWLQAAKKLKDEKSEEVALCQMGAVLKEGGNHDEAVRCYEEGLQIARRINDVRGEGELLNGLGSVYVQKAQYGAAIENYDKALQIARKMNDEMGEARTLGDLGNAYLEWGKHSSALEYLTKSLTVCRKNNHFIEWAILNSLGTLFMEEGRFWDALEHFEKSLIEVTKRKNSSGEITVLNNVGNLYSKIGLHAKALEYYNKALQVAEKTNEEKMKGTILGNLAMVLDESGHYGKALKYLETSLAIAEKLEDIPAQESVLNNRGLVLTKLALYKEALQDYERCLKIARKRQNQKQEARSLTLLGEVYQAQGNYDKALANFRLASEISSKLGGGVLAKRSIGYLYLDMGQVANAESFIKEAGSEFALGRLALAKSDNEEARDYYERSRRAAEISRNADDLFASYTGLGMVYEKTGEYEQARQYYEQAAKAVEEGRSQTSPADRRNFLEGKAHGLKRVEAAKGLSRVLMKLRRPKESIQASEAVRARAFADKIFQRSHTEIKGVPPEIIEKDASVTTQLAALKKGLRETDGKNNPERYQNLTKEVDQLSATQQGVINMLWEKYPSYAAVKYPHPVTLQQAAVNPDEYILMYDLFDSGVGIKLIKGKQVVDSFIEDWPRKDLENEVNEFRGAFELQAKKGHLNKDGKTIEKDTFPLDLAHNLYKRLLARALQHVHKEGHKDTHITIIPDGVLASLQLEALVVEKENAGQSKRTYVGDLYAVSYAQSLTVLTLSRTLEAAKSFGDRVLVFANPVFNYRDRRTEARTMMPMEAQSNSTNFDVAQRLGPLPQTAALASELEGLYKSNCKAFEGFEAQKALIGQIGPGLADFRYLIFATHGLFGNEVPGLLEPCIALTMVPPGTDGLLKMTEVMGLPLNADVVALTACRTGLGNQLSGEGVMSMGRAFQYAGAKTVLMSLWTVATNSSVELTVRFFKHLKDGKTKLEALRLARKEIREMGYDHPYFWAPFILVGNLN